MNKLKIVSGILCLVGSFVFFWSGDENTGLSGLGIINIIDVIQYFSSSHEYLYLIGYIFGVITTFSGLFILISRKSKVIPIIIGLLTFIQMFSTILFFFDVEIPVLSEYVVLPIEFFFFNRIANIFPFAFYFGDYGGFGLYLLCIGSILSIIAGIKQEK